MGREDEQDPGVINGRFRCVRRLGAGAFGTVWLAVDEASNGVQVAVKLLHAKYCTDEEVLGRFRREAQILSSMDHPAIARPIAWDIVARQPFLAMELVQGRRLDLAIAQHLDQGTWFAREELLRLADELCAAVGYAHSMHVVHRDLKPKNIIVLERAGRMFVKVLDFGIAKILESDGLDKTASGRIMGSLLYMAPEQVQSAPVDHRADLFALGTIFFELLTLRNPWARDEADRPIPARAVSSTQSEINSDFRAMHRIVKEARPLASLTRPGVPASLDQVLLKAMSIDPAARHPNADALYRELAASLATLPATEARDSSGAVAPPPEHDAGEGRQDSRGSSGSSRRRRVRLDREPVAASGVQHPTPAPEGRSPNAPTAAVSASRGTGDGVADSFGSGRRARALARSRNEPWQGDGRSEGDAGPPAATGTSRSSWIFLLILLILAGGGAGLYWWEQRLEVEVVVPGARSERAQPHRPRSIGFRPWHVGEPGLA